MGIAGTRGVGQHPTATTCDRPEMSRDLQQPALGSSPSISTPKIVDLGDMRPRPELSRDLH